MGFSSGAEGPWTGGLLGKGEFARQGLVGHAALPSTALWKGFVEKDWGS